MIVIESAGLSDIGKKRKENQDYMFLDNAMGLYIVADGMGGHRAGEVASRLVVETIRDYFKQFHHSSGKTELIRPDASLSKKANHLLSSIHLSNKIVHQASLDNTSQRGMGSTVSAVYFTDDTIITANVGDSPIYLIRDGKIKLLSVLHTVLAEQAAIDPQNAERLGREFRHVLTRAMGTDIAVKADIYEIPCFKDDILVISSDGLSDKATPEEILAVVNSKQPDQACQHLVELANKRGGDDNVTTIVLKVELVQYQGKKIRRFFSSLINRITNKHL